MRTLEAGSRPPSQPGSPRPGAPQIGDVLDGRYRITGVLGSGGMGCVYLAEHVNIRRPLALKLLHPDVEGVEGIGSRFEREAFAIGRVDHPNCVNVSDFGRLQDGTLYMVLELLDGTLLFDLLAIEGQVHWRRALHITRHVASALAYAHDAGIVHRDIKPENVILVDQDGDHDFAKILDFGVAKLSDEARLQSGSPGETQIGVTIGTPTYVSPEQAFGQPVDARTDLYSLSIMLFEMIVGAPPFQAEDVVTLLSMQASDPAPAIHDVAPEVRVPPSVESLIRSGLEKKRNARIPSAAEYIERIDDIIACESSGTHPVSEERFESEPPSRPSLVDSLRAGADGLRDTLIPTVAGAITEVQGLQKPKKRKGIIAASAVVVVLTAVLAAFGGGGPDYLPTRTHLPLVEPKHGPEAETAAELLEQGHPKEAAAFLIENKKKVREEPYAQLVLGHAHATAQRNVQALIAYEKAVSLEPTLAKDELFQTNLELLLDKKTARVLDAAIDLLATLVRKADDDDAKDQLVHMASYHEISPARQRAVTVAEEVGLGDRIDRLSSYVLDLQHGDTCADRRDAVAKLRALGDKQAIPALRKARRRIRSEGRLRKKINTNACLRADAAEAIRYLESL